MCLQFSALFILMTFPPSYRASLIPAGLVKCFSRFTKQRNARKEAEWNLSWRRLVLYGEACLRAIELSGAILVPMAQTSEPSPPHFPTCAGSLLLTGNYTRMKSFPPPKKLWKLIYSIKRVNTLVFLFGETRDQNVSTKILRIPSNIVLLI